jgi:hypothetical protein
MRIVIKYESSWRNSFLDGSNNEPLPKGGRGFVGSMTSLKTEGNFIKREVSLDTVMGILNRLIGDQRKLYQARAADKYFFKDIEPHVRFEDQSADLHPSSEIAYIRNTSGSTDQNAFTGMIKSTDPAFTSNFSSELWGVLYLSFDDLLNFINDSDYKITESRPFDPLVVINQLENLNGLKTIDVADKVEQILELIKSLYPDIDYKLTAKGQITPICFYASALYIQLERLKNRFDLSPILTKSGGLSGISKRGFTKKDFMDRYTTGSKKLIWGNPFILKERIKGIGEVTSMLTKARGTLKIDIDIPQDQSEKLKEMIDAAGVSSFYLGKKGLAYVEMIR